MQMRPQPGRKWSLPDYVDWLQQSGRYTFLSQEARDECGLSPVAFKHAARRLVLQARLATPRRGFFVVVPLEYRSTGAPPPAWYIDALMKFHGRPYYVALLSAAALHGAAHQQPQEFQVVTDEVLRPATAGKNRLRFFFKKRAAQTLVTVVKTETGSMRVSSPEVTAVDLVRYPPAAGGLGNIVTVLSELAERIDAERLVEAARAESDVAAAQRTGFLLDQAGAAEKTEVLARWIEERGPRTIRLRPERDVAGAVKSSRWRVLVNEQFEIDE